MRRQLVQPLRSYLANISHIFLRRQHQLRIYNICRRVLKQQRMRVNHNRMRRLQSPILPVFHILRRVKKIPTRQTFLYISIIFILI